MNSRQGLTLLELLVVMAIITVVMTALLNWQMNTLNVTLRTNAMSRSLTDLNDVTGYVGDRVRAAKIVRVSDATNVFYVNGNNCDASTPCMSIFTTVENSTDGKQYWYHMVYRMEPRGSWVSAAKVANAWADDPANNIFVLTEYRTVCNTTDCSSLQLTAEKLSNFTNMAPLLVTDSLTMTGPTGTFTPFAYDPATGEVTLKLQYKQQNRNQATFTPAADPYTLKVQARNTN